MSGMQAHRLACLYLLAVGLAAPASASPPRLAAGTDHALIIATDGQLLAVGGAEGSVLGLSDPLQPTPLPLPEPVRALATARLTSFAWTDTGVLYAWGNRFFGQSGLPFLPRDAFLGFGGYDGTVTVAVPVQTDRGWRTVSTSGLNSTYISADGQLFQSGATRVIDGRAKPDSGSPVRAGPTGVYPWVAAAQGESFTLGLQSDGSLWAWGAGPGLGKIYGNYTAQPVPVAASAPEPAWIDFAAGDDRGFGVRADGSLWAWGLGYDHPARLSSELDWAAVFASPQANHSLALKQDGSLWGWGYNSNLGELDAGLPVGNVTAPVALAPGERWRSAAVGANLSAAVREDGSLWLWGSNAWGELGQGDRTQRSGRQQVLPGHCWQAVRVQTYLVHALDCDGQVYNWGSDADVGRGRTTPTRVGGDQHWVSVAAAVSYSAGVDADGRLWVWGSAAPRLEGGACANGYCPLPTELASGDFRHVWAGIGGLLVLDGSGNAWGLGDNYAGQLGLGDTRPHAQLSPLAGLWQAFAPGPRHLLAIAHDGTLWSSGNNSDDALCRPGAGIEGALAQIGQDAGWVAVAVSERASYALKQDGSLWACGENYRGQLGIGGRDNSPSLAQVQLPIPAVQVAAGNQHALALGIDGSLWAWGYNDRGQLGTGDGLPHARPVRVGTRNDWAGVAAAGDHSYALGIDGQIWGFGDNQQGELGTGDIEARALPTAMQPLPAP